MRYWVREYHIDGVHLYCDEHSLNVLAADPQLADTKIITVGWNSDRVHISIWQAVIMMHRIR